MDNQAASHVKIKDGKLVAVRINYGEPGDRFGAHLDAMRFVRIVNSRRKQAAEQERVKADLPEIPDGMIHVAKYAREHMGAIARDTLSALCRRSMFRSAQKYDFLSEGNGRRHTGWFVAKDEIDAYIALPPNERRYAGMLLRRGGTDEVWEYILAYQKGFRRERTKRR